MTDHDVSQSLAERAEAPAREGPTIAQLIARQRSQIEAAVPRHVSAERLSRIALTEVRRTPRLGDCTPQSLLGALMLCAQLGLEPGPLGQAYLVPYRNNRLNVTECQFILGYKGIVDLAWRSGRLRDIQAREVFERDAFTFRYGLNEALDHTPTLNGERGPVRCFWGLANFTDGGHYLVVASPADIEEHRKRSRAADGGPWVTDPIAMAKKTVVRMMQPFLPLSAELVEQLAVDEAVVHDIPLDFRDVADVVDAPAVAQETPPASQPRRRGRPRRTEQAEQRPDGGTGPARPAEAPVESGSDTGEMASAPQLRAIDELLTALGDRFPGPIEERPAAQQRYIAAVTGRMVTDYAELTIDEAADVIRTLRAQAQTPPR